MSSLTLAARALDRIPDTVLDRVVPALTNRSGDRMDSDVRLSLAVLNLATKDFSDLPVDQARSEIEKEAAAGNPGSPAVLAVTTQYVGGVLARVYYPIGAQIPRPAVLYAHGGGWTLGSTRSHDSTARFLCHRAEVIVISLEYPLAPEHPHPTALLAVNDALDAVLEGQVPGVDPHKVIIAGDSAGGHLSAAVSLLRADSGSSQPVAQMLFVPVTNLSRLDTVSYDEFARGYFLTRKHMRWYRNHYLGSELELATDWRVSPLLAPPELLARTAPAYVSVAGFDPLRDEGLAYAQALREAGVETTLRVNSGLLHPFVNSLGVWRGAREAMHHAVRFMRDL
ncbi:MULTISPECIES: alpha/beta hydrolase [Auritidibacter]|uniref:alpha/beta hydrolase n=1 Tax=Auritidibacter TaxID=1160973 RepID=UPI000D72A2F0|nr:MULTISPECIES: alpha/beta hydrolase [Auritidibacter]AXR74651.1 alpha/beta hydrolase [Auritidibacter sp. NML130574]NIH71039.1 acetyl esterase [Auritidibacter ignavus]RMX22987.1 alpha/beta hydrolase [Auritidibacter ignavus]WGH81189.1 alpha/beta hydrolase [Auritidibacter ignavus]WHS28875.1 alpha/beta hydrolase [Auritidibacter ignavus]